MRREVAPAAGDGADLATAYGQDAVEADRAGRLSALGSRLTRWLREGPAQMGGAEVVDLAAPGGGASSDLVVARLTDGRRLVVRLDPAEPIYPDPDLGRQLRCTAAASATTAFVPPPLWYEPDPGPLGRSFLVSTFVEGEAGTYRFERAVGALGADEQRKVWDEALAVLAAVHATPIDGTGPEDRLPGAALDPVERYLEYWDRYRAFVDDGRAYPALDAALGLLRSERPSAHAGEALVWGDARFGNILYDGLRPVAAVDFEFAHVGLPELDVAFFVHFDRISFEYFRPDERLAGFGDLDATFDRYEASTSRTTTARGWYELLAATYSALAVTRVMQLRAAAGHVPEELVTGHPSMRALADLLEERW